MRLKVLISIYFYKLSFYLWYVWMNKMLSVNLEPYVDQCIVTQV